MRRTVLLLFALSLATLAWAPVAFAEKRVALVIGNGAYANATPLPNPRNDAEDVAAALKREGFETIVGFDLDQAKMQETAITFARAAREADVALFYYSGHAMQFAGINYLMPVDAKLSDEADLRRMARVDDILADLQQAKNLRILVLDACRDNPFAEQLKRSIGLTRAASAQRGLARIDTPEGMIVAFSTQAQRTADDGVGRNSPHTTAFLKHIEEQEKIGRVFRRISTDVYEATEHRQLPELSLSMIGEYYLRGATPSPSVTSSAPSTPPAPPSDPALDAWNAAKDTDNAGVLDAFIAKFGDSFYASLAKAKLAELKRKEAETKIAVVVPPKREVLQPETEPGEPPADGVPENALGAAAVGGDFPCSLERSLKSLAGDHSITLTFRNLSKQAINAYWLDYTGKRVFYQRIDGGGSYVQQTYISHPWVFIDGKGKCRKIILPGSSQKTVTVR
jgi:hypothetical protein